MMLFNRKTITGLGALCALLAIAFHSGSENFVIESALAQNSPLGNDSSNIFSQTASIAVAMITFMQTMAFLIIYLLQELLNPSFLSVVMNGSSLIDIWKFSRDLMNIIFAFMLFGAGILIVIGRKEMVQEKYKRFILAVILVNFSWFFPRVILDVANVLTATVYQMPAAIGNLAPCTTKDVNGNDVACEYVNDIKLGATCKGILSDQENNGSEEYVVYAGGVICVKYEAISTLPGGENTSVGMFNGLVLGYGRLANLAKVLNPDLGPNGGEDKMERLSSYIFFLIHIILIVSLMAMLFFPLLSMLVVFIIRIPIIWFTVSFMPFMFLGFVAEDKLTPGFNTFEIFKKFVKAAFLPVAVAVPIAIGFVLLNTMGNKPCAQVMEALGGADHPFCVETGQIIYGINDAWSLLWLLMAFFVIWIGFYSALKIDETYVNVTNGIKNFGSSVGNTAIKMPLSIPIPIGTDKSMSLNQMKNAPQNISAKLESQSIGSALGSTFGGGGTGGGQDGSAMVTNAIQRGSSRTNALLAEIAKDKGLGEVNATNAVQLTTLVKTDEYKDRFNQALDADGLTQSQINNIDTGDITSSITANLEQINDEIDNMTP